ncbi:hypothetical protein KAU33_15500 [Candidatus Dependentiae bacterium]|nr:hypothetical protein [Candidatus Dependentiae bacterium]
MGKKPEKDFVVSLNVSFDTASGATAKTKGEAGTKAISELKSHLKNALDGGNIANLSIEIEYIEED